MKQTSAINQGDNGKIELDSPFAQEIGFTSDKFDGWLWLEDARVLISFIISRQPGEGHLSQLFSAIEARGFAVAVPTPMGLMRAILARKGFTPHGEYSDMYGEDVEVWEKR